jgi:rhodanese-related sulfurtransferase
MNRPMAIPQLDPLYADLRRRDLARPALLLDVRELDEFRQVRVADSLFIPMSQLGVRIQDIPRDRPLLVICQSGSRSMGVTNYLLQQGFEDVGNVAGGIDGWQRLGLPVRTGPIEDGEGQLPG